MRVDSRTVKCNSKARQVIPAWEDMPEVWSQLNMEEVLRADNVREALRRVEANRGRGGVDGMSAEELRSYLKIHWKVLKQTLLEDRYKPKSVFKVEIPKSSGKGKRMLGIPTVLDRFIQQSLLQVMQRAYDPTFSKHSFGFRPNRSAHDAIIEAREHVLAGHRWVVDIDLEKFFDQVNHDMLMSMLANWIKDKRVLRLIRRFLQSGLMADGICEKRVKGTPQGGPLSPLLSNIILDNLDRELERRGHRFVRYADDCNIYVKSKTAGERVLSSISNFLNKKLKLKVNSDKSAVRRPWATTFLGYSMTHHRRPRLKVPKDSLKRFRANIRPIFQSGSGRNIRSVLKDLAPKLRGWVAYYRLAEVKSSFEELDSWLRRRCRLILWQQWKRPKTRKRKLISFGLSEQTAWKSSYNGRRAWWNAGSIHMNLAITTKVLRAYGLICLQDERLRLSKLV